MVVAPLGYMTPGDGRPYDYAYPPPDAGPWHNYEADPRPVRLADARGVTTRPSLAREGFELRETPTQVADFRDEEAIRSVYYREAAELARAATGAGRAYVFDHLVRRREAGRPALTFGRRVASDRPSANGRVHNDYTEGSGRKRLELVLEDASGAAAVRRHAIVNIWRSIGGPVLDTPLALCDSRTVAPDDLVDAEVRYARRTGEIYLVRHSARHRWSYFSAMDRHEALIFKQYDSSADGVPRFVPHAAFDHPHTPPDAPLRLSIEVRCLVVFD